MLFFCVLTELLLERHELHAGYTFAKYVKEHGKSYGVKEVAMRKRLFEQGLAEVIKHNADPTKTWKMGVNRFTDMTLAEKKRFLGG